jgi:hypothetical protein
MKKNNRELIDENPKEKEIDETNINIQHECPKCGYTWSGSSINIKKEK